MENELNPKLRTQVKTRALIIVMLSMSLLACTPAKRSGDASLQTSRPDSVKAAELIEELTSLDISTAPVFGRAADILRDLANYPEEPGVIEALVSALDDSSYWKAMLSITAAVCLGDIGSRAAPLVINAIDEPHRRRGAIDALTHMDTSYEEATRKVISYLEEPNYTVQLACLGYLEKWGDGGADTSPLLTSIILCEDEFLSRAAASVAGELGYGQRRIYNALISAFMRRIEDKYSYEYLKAMARLAPVPDDLHVTLQDALTNELNDLERIWLSAVLYMDDPGQDAYIGTIVSYLRAEDQSLQGHAISAIKVIVSEVQDLPAEACEQLRLLLQDPVWGEPPYSTGILEVLRTACNET